MPSDLSLHPGGAVRKGYRSGTHRLISPAETLEKVLPWMPAFGITRIANITGLDVVGLPVVMVCRPNGRSLSVSQGKGCDLLAAKVSGLSESIETYHAEHITLPLKLATYNELRSVSEMVDVDALPRVALSPFHPNLRILWIEGFDLLQDTPVWVPYEMVHMDYTLPFPPGSGCFATSSSGLASGNHVLEAVSHGICEVVERDANTLWHGSDGDAQIATRIDLSTVSDALCRDVLGRFEEAGIDAFVWETTSDTGVPSFYCVIVEKHPTPFPSPHPSSGSGCHPAREVALMRALTEAAQSRLTMIAGSRDDKGRGDYFRATDALNGERTRFKQNSETPWRNFNGVPTFESGTLDADVGWLLRRLRSIDCRSVIAVDLTKADLGISVVRVLIPGLEPAYDLPGYTPGPRARRHSEARIVPSG